MPPGSSAVRLSDIADVRGCIEDAKDCDSGRVQAPCQDNRHIRTHVPTIKKIIGTLRRDRRRSHLPNPSPATPPAPVSDTPPRHIAIPTRHHHSTLYPRHASPHRARWSLHLDPLGYAAFPQAARIPRLHPGAARGRNRTIIVPLSNCNWAAQPSLTSRCPSRSPRQSPYITPCTQPTFS